MCYEVKIYTPIKRQGFRTIIIKEMVKNDLLILIVKCFIKYHYFDIEVLEFHLANYNR